VGGENDHVTLTVSDDGCGFDVAAATGKGLGLLSMNERVEAVGGTLQVVSRQESGTRLEVSVPLLATLHRERSARDGSATINPPGTGAALC
jgi:signal transduction histidine kinase